MNNFNEAMFKTKVDNVFVKLYTAIILRDLSTVKHFISDKLYNKYQAYVDSLIKNNASKDYKGKIATVKKDIGKFLSIDGIGLIEFDNNVWQAKSIDDKEIKANSKVEIVSKENMIMNVKVVK